MGPGGIPQTLPAGGALVLISTDDNNVNSSATIMITGQVETFYRHRRDALMAAADKHLVTPGLCEYSVPLAGTSLWIKVIQC